MGENDADEVIAAAARNYGAGQPVWHALDRWNEVKRRRIDLFVRRHREAVFDSRHYNLDAGCGSHAYDWMPDNTISLDRFASQLASKGHAVSANIERLPFRDEAFGSIVCIASVLNYVSAAETVGEFARTLRPKGKLVLHFETSNSLEHIGTARWNSSVALLRTINAGRDDTVWVYSPSYITALATSFGLRTLRRRGFHILSALALRLGLYQQTAALLAVADGPLGSGPITLARVGRA